jgi:hypothetical protein
MMIGWPSARTMAGAAKSPAPRPVMNSRRRIPNDIKALLLLPKGMQKTCRQVGLSTDFTIEGAGTQPTELSPLCWSLANGFSMVAVERHGQHRDRDDVENDDVDVRVPLDQSKHRYPLPG